MIAAKIAIFFMIVVLPGPAFCRAGAVAQGGIVSRPRTILHIRSANLSTRSTSSMDSDWDPAKNKVMAAWTREELLAFLNQMLEAERAGARALMHVAKDTAQADISVLAAAIQKDEARWCAMLMGAIKRLGGAPSEKTGAFYDKVMVLTDDKERLALVNRGQDWVVRKLREALPRIEDRELSNHLSVMLTSHEENIAKVAGSGLIGKL
jgi:hypothetical protein